MTSPKLQPDARPSGQHATGIAIHRVPAIWTAPDDRGDIFVSGSVRDVINTLGCSVHEFSVHEFTLQRLDETALVSIFRRGTSHAVAFVLGSSPSWVEPAVAGLFTAAGFRKETAQ